MVPPDLPVPDDLYRALVGSLFGSESLALYVFVLATWAWTWIAWAREMRHHGQRLSEFAQQAPGSPYAPAVFWVVVVTVFQTVYLALSYFIAGHLGDAMRQLPGPEGVRVEDWFVVNANAIDDPAFWVWFICAALVVVSGWWSAQHDGQLTLWHPVGWLMTGCGLVAGAVLLLGNRQLGVLAFVYVICAIGAQYAPERAVRSWQRLTAGPVDPLARPDRSW